MVLPLLCLDTILAPTCPASCQPSCSPPPLFRRGGLVPILQLLYDSPYAVLRHSPRSFTIRVGSWDNVVAVSRFKASMAADAVLGSPHCCSRLPGSRPGGLAATKRVLFSDPLVSSPSPPSAPPRDSPGTVFLPGKEVFARLGPVTPSQPPQTRYPSRQWAPPKRLDLWPLLLPAEARARGSPVESCLCPWRRPNQSGVL
jgi:hypothetical protein